MSKIIKAKLGDICIQEKGAVISGPFGSNISSKYFKESGIPVIRGNNLSLSMDKFYDTGFVFISEERANELKCDALRGDIIFTAAGTIGQVGIIPENSKYRRYVISNKQIRARIDVTKIDLLYAYYWFSSPWIKKVLINSNKGSTVPLLTLHEVKTLPIYYPEDLDEQRNIAEIIDTITNKIENNKIINTEIEDMAKAIYDYWFLQYDFPDENGRPYKSSGGEMVWNEELKREIPEGWRVDFLGNLFASNRGISYNSKTIEGNGVPMINLASFNVDGSYKESGMKTYSGQYTTDKVVKPFDLLMCNTQQTAIDYKKDIIGKAFLVPDIFSGDIVTSHHVTTIQVKKDNVKYFLHRLFNTDYFHKYVAGFTNGTNILGLIFSGIEKYRVEIPDDTVLDKFAELMIDIEMKKSKIIMENEELVSLRDFLLPLLMNGQVKFI